LQSQITQKEIIRMLLKYFANLQVKILINSLLKLKKRLNKVF